MKLTKMVLVLALCAPAVAFAEGEGLPRSAFLVEMRLGAGAPVGLGGITPGGSFSAVPSLLVGARLLDRIQLGLGISFLRLSNSGGALGGGASDLNVVTFAPSFSGDVVKSHDNRVALYLKAGLPLGPVIRCPTGGLGAGSRCDNSFAIGFDFGVGARYSVHRMFAAGLEAGVQGSFIDPQRNDTTGAVTFYGALVGSFYAGGH
jgi:hypothetical protein